ncbi:adenylyl-sulfate kinase [Bradyrhizobium sp. CER78]|uniref:adenylyl-sulfate kinase n=1 Tax=Bradyrhizobium sp. CER78 TaxID=3039162 RepID=UPI0024474C5F|nr:adenylyl-sulfate kinase [Bradyrhizobium sp. CER78]MDH2382200.1 adenylyl-sulfate kinase [Bradyrhizobium sp. CER78]
MKQSSYRDQLKLVVAGHVDHGKSTLIGRLLHETGSLPEGKVEELRRISEKRGMPLEWSFVLDAFQAERDQAITIDTTWIWLRTGHRDTVIIDAPGHREFLKNMISGAANADAGLLVVDALEGVKEQTRRHAYLLKLLGINQVVVAINKIDLVDNLEAKFRELEADVRAYLKGFGIEPTAVVPISAREGDNLTALSPRTPWYSGPTLLETFSSLNVEAPASERPLRIVVQDVYKFDERRIVAGKVTSGSAQVGDTLMFSPHDRIAKIARIEPLDHLNSSDRISAGESVGIVLDEQIFVERGNVASHFAHPPVLSNVFRGKVFWLGEKPLRAGATLRLRAGTLEAQVTVRAIESLLDLESLEHRRGDIVTRNDLATVRLSTSSVLPVADGHDDKMLGRFVLLDGFDTVGGGLIDLEGIPDQRSNPAIKATNIKKVDLLVSRSEREIRHGHKGAVIWLTGLSGAGKSTLALRAERTLFEAGWQTYVLDGDNLRHGLNSDLGFSADDRSENIRRIGEVASLFASAGLVVLTALISPYHRDRNKARSASRESFHEIYVKASLDACESRDAKGLYRRARAGEIKEFTGVSAPYEAPQAPELVIDTEQADIERCVHDLTEYIRRVCSR